ncbi:MAG: MBOAT family protein [Lachnospiraceae bacterium]|nr:MBOAT family protein [Lachnospiraceae bacterium]
MVFSSFTFLFFFLPIILAVCYVAPFRLRNGIIFLGSLFFYAWGEPVYVLIMLFSTVVDFAHGWLVERYRGTVKSRVALISSILVNLGLLGFFKYSGLVPLPIGISFYTFQTMSYTIDVYRGKVPVQKNIIDFGAYVTMFPQLIAGPIVRYSQIQKELTGRKITIEKLNSGLDDFFIGLGKKVLLANSFGELWKICAGQEQTSILGAWLGILAFALQIYFDFSGYSDMAIGLGKMLGFTFPENFQYPYISKSITEFWRRWHITLGMWFREYVYIPLGGSRRGKLVQLRNILIVWLLTGIWHGAGWNFLIWGLYFAILLMMEKMFLLRLLEKLPGFVAHLYSLLAIIVGWVIFAFDSLIQGVKWLQTMIGFTDVPLFRSADLYYLKSYGILLLIGILASTPLCKRLGDAYLRHPVLQTAGLIAIGVLCFANLAAGTYNPFLYFRF